MIAEHVGGSVDHFVEMMNEEAASIGATSSHFMNPHGLTNPEHYTSVYDIYLIYNILTFSTIANSINFRSHADLPHCKDISITADCRIYTKRIISRI